MIQIGKARGYRIAGVVVAIGLAATAALTQTLPRNQAEFEQQIGMTPAQKQKITAINKKYQPKLQAIKDKYRPKAEPIQKQMMELQKKLVALNQQMVSEATPILKQQEGEVKAVFSPDQRKKIEALEAQQRQMMQQMQQQQGGGGGR